MRLPRRTENPPPPPTSASSSPTLLARKVSEVKLGITAVNSTQLITPVIANLTYTPISTIQIQTEMSSEPATKSSSTDKLPMDPLDLVIAKRKRKEFADPVIAEAILTASKLPPPLLPEALDTSDVPEEIQQLIAFADERQSSEKDVEFFRNYSLFDSLKTKWKLSENVPVQPLSRYSSFRDTCREMIVKLRNFDWDDYTSDGSEENRGSSFQTVHTDEDWFMESVLHVVCVLLIVLTLPLSLFFCLKVVAHYERAVLFRLGRLVSATAQGPGVIIVLPCLDRYRILDLRTFTFDVPTQEVLTKDSVTVVVNAVVYYRVRDPVRAVVNVEDANRATRVLGQTTLRNVLGTVNLDQLLTAREDIAALMQECFDSVTEAWGVKVERVEIKDVRLPIQLQRAMAAEAESVREATARVIAAEGEMHAAGALKAAAFEIQQHPIAMQLRFLQAVNSISSGKESTIFFPVPLDVWSFVQSKLALQDNPNPEEQLKNLAQLQMNTLQEQVLADSSTPSDLIWDVINPDSGVHIV